MFSIKRTIVAVKHGHPGLPRCPVADHRPACRADAPASHGSGAPSRARILFAMDERIGHALRGSGRPLLACLPALAWAALIFVSSAQPSLSFAPDPGLDFVIRKTGHMGVFGILALLVWRAVAGTTTGRRLWAWALALTVLYAVTDELHQGFVGREATVRDVALDAAGAVIALTALAIVRAVRLRRARQGPSSPG